MKNTNTATAYRTDLAIGEPNSRLSVTFEVDGQPVELDGQVSKSERTHVVEITTNPQGAAAGRKVVMRPKVAERLGLGYGDAIVRAVVRPVDSDDQVRTSGMFDGRWAESSDSRWPFFTPVPIHDRFEF